MRPEDSVGLARRPRVLIDGVGRSLASAVEGQRRARPRQLIDGVGRSLASAVRACTTARHTQWWLESLSATKTLPIRVRLMHWTRRNCPPVDTRRLSLGQGIRRKRDWVMVIMPDSAQQATRCPRHDRIDIVW